MSRTAICRLCDSNIQLTLDGTFRRHTVPTGLPEDGPFAYRDCQACGATPSESLRLARTFYDSQSKDILLEVGDGGDTVSFETIACFGGSQSVKLSVDVKGNEVRKLIAQLTEIADARGF